MIKAKLKLYDGDCLKYSQYLSCNESKHCRTHSLVVSSSRYREKKRYRFNDFSDVALAPKGIR